MKWAKCAVSILLFISLGCGGGTPADMPDIASVSGVVTLDGNPLPNAKVTFQPVGEGRPSTGISDSSGNFTLRYTVDADGAMIGDHRVKVSLIQEDGAESSYGGENEEGESGAATGLPASASDGSITETVKEGSNDVKIELTSD